MWDVCLRFVGRCARPPHCDKFFGCVGPFENLIPWAAMDPWLHTFPFWFLEWHYRVKHFTPSSNFLNHYFQTSSRFLPACRFQSKHFRIRVGGFWCIAQSLSKEKPTCNYKLNDGRTFTATRWIPVDVLQIPQRRYNSFWLVLAFQHCPCEAHTMQSTNPLPP